MKKKIITTTKTTSDTKLPPVDLKFQELVVDELVTLIPQFDDKNFKRVYKILERENNLLTVEVISENAINDSRQQAEHSSSVGKIFRNIEALYFQPYL